MFLRNLQKDLVPASTKRSEHNSISGVPTPDPLGVYVPAPDPLGGHVPAPDPLGVYVLASDPQNFAHANKPSWKQYVGTW